MKIHSKFKDYEVTIHEELSFLEKLCRMENAQFVIDRQVYELYRDYLTEIPQERLMLIEALEENKVISTALDICEVMTEIPAKRNAVLVSVGGGIIQDITGFVANVLYRGIAWHFVPTTLLASCDSCIGGKTSLNYKKYKNLLGTFYPPDEVHICPAFFKTLSERDYKSGLGEVVKFNLMAGREGLQNISENIEALLAREDSVVSRFVHSSLLFKKDFIEVDECDRGERIKLNFAHTFGHAIEVVSEYGIPHGTAVAIGMIIADRIAVCRGMLDSDFAQKSQEILLKVIDIDIKLLDQPTERIIDAIRKDKKQVNAALTAVLMTNIPKDLKIVHDVTVAEVEDGFRFFEEQYAQQKAQV